LLKKGIPYKVIPTLGDKMPAGITQLPALSVKGEIIFDSLAIAEYIEKTYPHTSLTRQGAYSYQEVLEKSASFFPTLSSFIKNKDDSKDPALQAAVESQLDTLDEIIRSTPGQYMCGIEMTLADLYLVPQLFHAMVNISI
jgi:glutathione S-transferase